LISFDIKSGSIGINIIHSQDTAVPRGVNLSLKPIVRQGFKPLLMERKSSQRGLKKRIFNSLVLFERTFAMRQGIDSLAD
jgi:hypothetical protein